MVMTALAAASRWARGAAELATKPGGRDEDRLASGLFLLVTGSGAAAGALWALAYGLLGRPLLAANPRALAAAATSICITMLPTPDLWPIRALTVALSLSL